MLQNSDEDTGTNIFDDGYKLYWASGRSSSPLLVAPDGTKKWLHPVEDFDEEHFVLDRNGPPSGAIVRESTPEEEQEWYMMKNS